ncbi:MAG: penicillin-binding protein 2 [Clostridia bacterium]|nr:penicillin-binding protein 2 [Clostridia bacterium]
MSNSFYAKLFAKRSFVSFFMVMLLLLTCILRVAVVATKDDYKQIQANQSAYKIEVARPRGTIYDCNMVPITNSKTKTIAAVLPTPRAITAISKYIDVNGVDALKNNMPAICEVPKKISAQGVSTTLVYEHISSDMPACHIIGYTDNTGHGISGLERAYDNLLYNEKTINAIFTTDGKGNSLCGIEPYFENAMSSVNNGVVTTLDINIQNITEKSVSKLNSGCAIVSEVQTGKIRALASVPTFNANSIYNSLNKSNSPMLNRAISLYSVGSVFKPCVAAIAIENGYANRIFNCKGNLEIEKRKFKCHKLTGHGDIDLCNSLAQSCNCYFYDTALSLGAEKVYKIAAHLSIGAKIKIADNFYTTSGNVPTLNKLNTKSTLANLSIGQGSLMCSPIAMLNLYTAIAGDGSYYLPSVVEKTIKDGAYNIYDIGYKTKVMEATTAKQLREFLKTVITDGTGTDAKPTLCTAAGKTATAQTGRYYEDGSEITNSWFCGFFPADEPMYAVVVMSDSQSEVSTASVFAEIADGITEFKTNNT